MKTDNFNDNLLKFEFFEYSNHLVNIFADALEDTYSFLFTINEDKISKGWKILNFDCNQFKNEFFTNGNPNTDVLLQLFMAKYDEGGMIRDCIESNIQSSSSVLNKNLIEKIKADIEGLRSEGFEYLLDVSIMEYMNSSSLNSFLLNERKVLIKNGDDLYWLLRRMKESNLINKKDLEAIVKFKNYKNPIPSDEWNQEGIEKYLRKFESF